MDEVQDVVFMRASGVYKIVCKESQRTYIGSAKNIMVRFASHIVSLSSGKHPNRGLQEDWNRYGHDGFQFQVVRQIQDRAAYLLAEKELIGEECARGIMPYNIQSLVKPNTKASPKPNRRSVSEILAEANKLPRLKTGITLEELSRLMTPSEAAKAKGMSLNTFKYNVAYSGGLKPKVIGNGHVFYFNEDVQAWNPTRQEKRKNTRKGLTAGKAPAI